MVTTGCQPVAQAKIEFWQANDAGEYDNSGYTLRGHQFTDAQGRYALQTVVPGLYPGRTRHIHVKVQAPNSAGAHHPALLPGRARERVRRHLPGGVPHRHQGHGAGKDGTFTFVLNG